MTLWVVALTLWLLAAAAWVFVSLIQGASHD